MDVAGTALAVASAAATTTLAITKLVIEARGLKEELEATQAELTSIDGVLFSIADIIHGNTYAGSAISAPLLRRLADVVKRCETAVAETSSLVRRFAGGGVRRTAQWFIAGKEEVTTMQSRLARCKQDLNVALSMLNISVSNSVHAGTSQLLQGQDTMQRDVQQIIIGVRSLQDDHVKMDELLVLLRSLSSQATHNVMLDRFVNNLTDYAQTVYERSTVAGDGDLEAYAGLPSRSPPASPGEIGDDPITDLAHFRVSPDDQQRQDSGVAHQSQPPVRSSQPSSTRTAAPNSTQRSRHDAPVDWEILFDDAFRPDVDTTQTKETPTSRTVAVGKTSQVATTDSHVTIVALPSASQPAGALRRSHFKPYYELDGDLDRALSDAIRKTDVDGVLELLKAGANPSGKVDGSMCCPGAVDRSPLLVALSQAVAKNCLAQMVPIVDALLDAGSVVQWDDGGSCPGNGDHASVLSRFIELAGTQLPDGNDPRMSPGDAAFAKGNYDTDVYRNGPAVADKLIEYGADPNHSHSRATRPLRLALETYNPALASLFVLRLGGVPTDQHLQDPVLRYFDIDIDLTITIVLNILIQHRHQETSSWLRYLIAADERIGAALLCLTMTLFSHPGSRKWNYSDLEVALSALISFDANPLLDVHITYQKDKPAYPSRQYSPSGTSSAVFRTACVDDWDESNIPAGRDFATARA
ncbi:hypothetical protein Micbo1qcDRAFT_214331 [Microdochium bolleyi]|uniref:Fungal N-terminal domain-containing protein n=1 Tax=Microdochium bolleyi TaxID=196109 RepID=A0A136IU69_9PEZI|nr:hypothetical protein Micbo1qcDRAFT_214331 [Microdochium bolleyi]